MTNIIPKSDGAAHYYTLDGQARHFVPKKDGSGNRPTTLADARKENLLPSVTTIITILAKPALERWKIAQACMAVLTAPKNESESLDAFVERVLSVEKQQDQEAQIARDKGSEIHDAIEAYFNGLEVPEGMDPWVRPVLDALMEFGQKASSEIVLVGDDYAGQADLLQDCGEWYRLWDFKGTKNLPDPAKGAWLEHRLQLAAYGMAFKNKLKRAGQVKPILVGNIYISSINAGQYVICEHEDWETSYSEGFAPLVRHWQFVNRYRPNNPNRTTVEKAQGDVVSHYQVENGKLKQEIEDLRAKLAVAETNPVRGAESGDNPPVATSDRTGGATPPTGAPEKETGEPAVIPATVQELRKSGKRVAWSTGTLAPSNGPQGTPLPGSGAPGSPSGMVMKDPPLPPGVVPRKLVNGPNGPVMQ